MIVEMQEYVAERGEMLRGQVQKLRETSSESIREAITGSAETIKSLKSPVRAIALERQAEHGVAGGRAEPDRTAVRRRPRRR